MGNPDKPNAGQDLDFKPAMELTSTPIDESLNPSDTPIRSQNDYLVLPYTFWLATSSAATAANYPPIINVGFPMVLLFAYESHGTAESGAATLQVDKLTSGQAQGDGVNMLTSGLDLQTTANTPVKYNPTTTIANARVSPGDRVEIRQPTGSLSAVRDVCVTLYFRVNLKDLPN